MKQTTASNVGDNIRNRMGLRIGGTRCHSHDHLILFLQTLIPYDLWYYLQHWSLLFSQPKWNSSEEPTDETSRTTFAICDFSFKKKWFITLLYHFSNDFTRFAYHNQNFINTYTVSFSTIKTFYRKLYYKRINHIFGAYFSFWTLTSNLFNYHIKSLHHIKHLTPTLGQQVSLSFFLSLFSQQCDMNSVIINIIYVYWFNLDVCCGLILWLAGNSNEVQHEYDTSNLVFWTHAWIN